VGKKEKSINSEKEEKEKKSEKYKKELKRTKRELEEERKKANDYFKRLEWMQAEYENLQKRIERENEKTVKFANGRLIEKLLVVVDDFGRIANNLDDKKIKEGMRMVLKNFMTILRSNGLEKIDSVGKKLNPLEHEVVDMVNDDNIENDVIVEELRTGYRFNGKVLRSALVRINKNEKDKNEKDKRGEV